MFDTHAHVHDPAYDEDREAMFRRAHEAGVSRILTVGCDLPGSRNALELARGAGAGEGIAIDASVGIHPHEAKEAPTDLATAFDALIAETACQPLAIGETGLDYYYDHSPREQQRRVFIEQIRYARNRCLPLIFHTRDAYDDFTAILRAEFARPMRGVVHCFTGDALQARTYVDEFGLLLGIGGVVTFKSAQALREAVLEVGLEHIILETDCPYLAPVPYRGKRNEPAYISATATKLAELFATDAGEVAARTGVNAEGIFKKPNDPGSSQ